jgi:hypothetical protein
MLPREQSFCYLKQYIVTQKATPWIAKMNHVEDRARCALQHLGGMAGDWFPYRHECQYYYPQRKQEC